MSNLEFRIDTVIEASLVEHGLNPLYVDAMLRKGFNLGSPKAFIGCRYIPETYWRKNYGRALKSSGVSINPSLLKKHEKRLRSADLILERDKMPETCLSLNPKWVEVADSYLREYLKSVL